MNYKTSYLFLRIGVIGGVCIDLSGLILRLFVDILGQIVTLCGLVVMLAGMLQASLFCRCPQCGTLLNGYDFAKLKRCHNCGYNLD